MHLSRSAAALVLAAAVGASVAAAPPMTTSEEAAREKGRLVLELHRWYVAAGAVPGTRTETPGP